MKEFVLLIGDFACRLPQRINYRQSAGIVALSDYLRVANCELLVTHYEARNLFDIVRELGIRFCIPATSWLLGYRHYVNSLLPVLEKCGVVLIPSIEHILAYENKVMQTINANRLGLQTPLSFPVSTVEGLRRAAREVGFPFVFKTPDGFRSSGVRLVSSETELAGLAASRFADGQYELGTSGVGSGVVQEFLPNLPGDWKVIIVGRAAASLYREVRPGDFRASGSGRFVFRRAPDTMFNFVEDTRRRLGCPWISCDIAEVDGGYRLLEFQVVHFGTRTVDTTPSHVRRRDDGHWEDFSGAVELEREMAGAIVEFYVEPARKVNGDSIENSR